MHASALCVCVCSVFVFVSGLVLPTHVCVCVCARKLEAALEGAKALQKDLHGKVCQHLYTYTLINIYVIVDI